MLGHCLHAALLPPNSEKFNQTCSVVSTPHSDVLHLEHRKETFNIYVIWSEFESLVIMCTEGQFKLIDIEREESFFLPIFLCACTSAPADFSPNRDWAQPDGVFIQAECATPNLLQWELESFQWHQFIVNI